MGGTSGEGDSHLVKVNLEEIMLGGIWEEIKTDSVCRLL